LRRGAALKMKPIAFLPLLIAGFQLDHSIAGTHSEQGSAPSIGAFDGNGDVGTVLHPGSAEYDPLTKVYTVTGSGQNMWFGNDDFQFVWKKVSGDVTLTADVSLLGTGGDNHRKAALMFRQSLDAGAAYADAAVHGDGLTSLQFRDQQGATTHEIQANVSGPRRLRLMKRGDRFYLWFANPGEPLQFAGGSTRIPLTGTFYVGIGVCAHNKDAVQMASFSNVEILTGKQPGPSPSRFSTLETITVSSTDARAVYVWPEKIEAPNWSPDGKALLFNSNGAIQRIAVTGGKAERIDTGLASCNSSHGLSPGGSILAVSAEQPGHGQSAIYTLPSGGGQPRILVSQVPSFFHGWSPDGSTIAFSGIRDGASQVYTIPVAGGQPKELTNRDVNDGPEFSPDGKFIYFASNRGGSMQVWRMLADGSAPEQVTKSEEWNNAFPHLSPDGGQLVYLSYARAENAYPDNKDVLLQMLSLADQKVKVLARFVGGRGTIDSPSWSPESKRLAFVSYQSIE
jgi:TolB protein